MNPKTVHLITFGCQMNKLDSELALASLLRAGCRQVSRPEDADVVLFNTCSVRQHAEDKVYSRLGALKGLKRKRPGLVIGVLGCMAQREGRRIFDRAPHVSLVCGTHMLPRLPELIERASQKDARVLATGDEADAELETWSHERPKEARLHPFHAYVAIMRGCNNYCAYCVVPYVRGPEVSRPLNDIVEEARRLADQGCREITLLGQNVNSYRRAASGGQTAGLPDLLTQLDAVAGIERIRFVTSHPKDLSRAILQAMASLPKVCEHLHMPAQAGSDRILRLMNRRYSAAHYLELVALAREIVADITVASDFIVGFPSETEADFQQTADLMRRVRFQQCFIFRYSPRPGTAAADLPDDVPPEAKAQRNQTLLDLQEEISREDNARLVGQTVEVLVEGPSKGDKRKLTGRTCQNHIVVFEGPAGLAGQLVQVEVTGSTPLTLHGRPRPE